MFIINKKAKGDFLIKRFSQYYKPHMKLFILDFGCAFLMSILDLIFPILVALIIDNAIPNKNLDLIIKISTFMLALYILRAVFDYIVSYWGHVLGVRIESDMRSDLFNHIQKLSFSYFDNTKTGHIMSRLVNDLLDIAEFAHHGPEDLFIASVTLLGSLTIMFLVNWQLALIITIIIPIMLYFTIIKNKKMRRVFKEMRIKVADINAQIEDSISGIRVVQSFGNEGYEENKFHLGNESYRMTKEESYKIMGEFYTGINFFSNMLKLAVIFFGGIFVYFGHISIGVLVQFHLYISIFIEPIKRIANFIEIFQKATSGFNRFTEILDENPDIVDSPKAKKVGKLKGEIVFKNVSFNYNNNEEVLKNINLEISAGETIAFVGPSGAGKTTICSLIPRFYEVSEGEILIDNINIQDIKLRNLRDNIGIVQPVSYTHLDVYKRQRSRHITSPHNSIKCIFII